MRDVEQTALDGATSFADLDRAIREAYWGRVSRAEARRPLGWTRVAIGAVGLIAGEAAGLGAIGTPFVGGIVGTAVGLAASELADRIARPRWLAVDTRLRGPRR